MEQCTGSSVQGAMYREQCTGSSVQGAVYREQCTGSSVQGAMYREQQCTGSSVQGGAVYREQCTGSSAGAPLTWVHLQHDELPTRSVVLGVAVSPCPSHTVPHHHAHIVHTRRHLPRETLHPEERVGVLSCVGWIWRVTSGIDEVTGVFSNEHCFDVSWVCGQVHPSESKHVTDWDG